LDQHIKKQPSEGSEWNQFRVGYCVDEWFSRRTKRIKQVTKGDRKNEAKAKRQE